VRVALVNPPWSFAGSVYFGCREPHLPIELGFARALLEAAGHDALLVDAQLDGRSIAAVRDDVAAFQPEMTVLTTAPSYLFWRCPPPELRVPMATARALAGCCGALVVVGPHASTSPRAVLAKLGADAAILGECEQAIVELASAGPERWPSVRSVVGRGSTAPIPYTDRRSVAMETLPALRWEATRVARHRHHHHRFDREPRSPGAEVEYARGCPYRCTFCAKDTFRSAYRRRPLDVVLDEIDALVAQGVTYVYFIDEIFLPDRALLEALAARDVEFGVQMRIDNWSREMLDLLGEAGCVSIEAGVESITPEGRSLLAKHCKATTEELTELLIHAKRSVPFVQANLLEGRTDAPEDVAKWRAALIERGVWANEPVPLFPYPGSPEYRARWGEPDDEAWERAHREYLAQFAAFSDVQESAPRPLRELEAVHG
jgi:B12-binding domain/radical SAM domain protein of rhizo-twelve system